MCISQRSESPCTFYKRGNSRTILHEQVNLIHNLHVADTRIYAISQLSYVNVFFCIKWGVLIIHLDWQTDKQTDIRTDRQRYRRTDRQTPQLQCLSHKNICTHINIIFVILRVDLLNTLYFRWWTFWTFCPFWGIDLLNENLLTYTHILYRPLYIWCGINIVLPICIP